MSAHRGVDKGERDAEPGGEVYGIRVLVVRAPYAASKGSGVSAPAAGPL